MITEVIPQKHDIAMEDFRRASRLTGECKVSADGKLMIYQLGTMADMKTWLQCANSIIITHKLPLVAKTQARLNGEGAYKVELRIIYKLVNQ